MFSEFANMLFSLELPHSTSLKMVGELHHEHKILQHLMGELCCLLQIPLQLLLWVRTTAKTTNSEDNNNSNEDMSAHDFQVASQNEYYTSNHTEFSIIDEPFVDRVGFFMRSGFINKANHSHVEFAIVIDAASLVTEGTRVSTAERDNQMKTEYIRIVNSFPNDMFESVSLKSKMRTRFTNAQKDLDGASLWKKFVLVRKDIRSLYLTNLPRDASSLPSGTNWRDAYDAFILHAYKLDKVSITIFVLNFIKIMLLKCVLLSFSSPI